MLGRGEEPQRSFLAGLMSVLLLELIIVGIIASCNSNLPSFTPIPTYEPSLVPMTILCPATSEQRVSPTYIWFIVDRSESMPRECSESLDALYLLPGFFIEIGKSLQAYDNIPLYSAIRFIGPNEEILTPTLVSDIRMHVIPTIGNSPTNEYGEALEEVRKEMVIREPRRVMLLLTDGSFSLGYAEKEAKEISEALRQIQNLGGEAYVLLCSENNKEFWEELSEKGLLTAPPYQFPEGVVEIGTKIFPEVRGTGWFTNPDFQIPFPREGLSASVRLLTITDNDRSFELSAGRILQLNPIGDLARGKMQVYEAVGRDFPIDINNCQAQPLSVRRAAGVIAGFYVVRSEGLSAGRVFTVTTEVSVNNGQAKVSFLPSRGLLSSDCYTFSLESDEIEPDENTVPDCGQGCIMWKPVDQDKGPRKIQARVWLWTSGDDAPVECRTISLPVKFAPLPLRHSRYEPICPIPDESIERIRKITFSFQYTPPSSRPAIYLCSPQRPPDRLHECDLKCGTPYPSGDTVECPDPEPRGGEYCVKAEFIDEPPTSSHPIVAREENRIGDGRYVYAYTIKLYECLEKYCGYNKIYFKWTDSDSTVNQNIVYIRQDQCWWWQSSAR